MMARCSLAMASRKLSRIIADRISGTGYIHQPDTIYRYIRMSVKDWQKPQKAT